jgi:hypothetical protein
MTLTGFRIARLDGLDRCGFLAVATVAGVRP